MYGFFHNNPEPGNTAGSFKYKCRICNELKSAKSGVNSNLNEHVKFKHCALWDEFLKYKFLKYKKTEYIIFSFYLKFSI